MQYKFYNNNKDFAVMRVLGFLIKNMAWVYVLLPALMLSSVPAQAQTPVAEDSDVCLDEDDKDLIWDGEGCIKFRTFQSKQITENPVLVIVVHGDSPVADPTYHYEFAKQIAAANNNVVAAGVLRPGYSDGMGGRSSGVRGEVSGDNYTHRAAETVVAAANSLRVRYNASTMLLVGHSGGAAISAAILGLYPPLFDQAVLVS
ncbi:MAG: lysophospholipase, partial [Gammaproteobacteria bacterium]|nr:lysophospholipase [Gammaproteobacteria bacterium]